MNQVLIIPDRKQVVKSLELSRRYDVGFEYNDFFVPDILDDTAQNKNVVQFYLQQELPSYTTMHGAFYDITIFSNDSLIREASKKRILQSMEIAVALGVMGVVFHSNINPSLKATEYRKLWLASNAEFFRQVATQYPQNEIYMENMFDQSPEDMKLLAKELRDVHNFGICLDYAHACISETPVKTWVQELASFLRHVHINDNDGKDDLHLAVGSGVTDWKKFEQLRKEYFPNQSILVETTKLESQLASLQYMERNQIIL